MSKIWNMVDGKGGKSGEFFYFSADRKFVLKTINYEEYNFLRSHLHDFYEHFRSNPHSLIAKIYGLFLLEGEQVEKTYRLILMKNITGCAKEQIKRVYDLKGSKYDREVAPSEVSDNELRELTLKDIDFQKLEHNQLRVSAKAAQQLKEQLRRDSEFLRKLNLIDYSLLIVKVQWQEQPADPEFWSELQRLPSESEERLFYHIGVIDYLQLWDLKKRGENWWKKYFRRQADISAVSPAKYSSRFVKFVNMICGGEATEDDMALSRTSANYDK